jgi:hypothetical protein
MNFKTNEKDNFKLFIFNQFRVKTLNYNISRHKYYNTL